MAGWTRLSPAFTSLRCRQAVSQEQQRGLLTLLPAIRNGSLDVNTFPRADNRTALHLARGPGSRQTVDWLLKNNASQIYVDSHGSPFMCTTDDNGPAIRKLLVQQSALGCPGMPDIIPADPRVLEAIPSKLYALHPTCERRGMPDVGSGDRTTKYWRRKDTFLGFWYILR